MKLLLDENLSYRIARDSTIVATIVYTSAKSLALTGAARPSVVLLRSADHLTPMQQADLIANTLTKVGPELSEGAAVSASPQRVRVRSLPISVDQPPEVT